MVSVEPIKYLLLVTDEVPSLLSKSEDKEISAIGFDNLNLLAKYGCSGKLAFRKNESKFAAFLQIVGLLVGESKEEEEEFFIERYGKLAINIITNSNTFTDLAKPFLTLGSKNHNITLLSEKEASEKQLDELEKTIIETMNINDTSKASNYNCTYVFLSNEFKHESNTTSLNSPLKIYNNLIKNFIDSHYLSLPPPNFMEPVDETELVNEIYLKQGSLTAKPPPLPPYSLFISLVYGPLKSLLFVYVFFLIVNVFLLKLCY